MSKCLQNDWSINHKSSRVWKRKSEQWPSLSLSLFSQHEKKNTSQNSGTVHFLFQCAKIISLLSPYPPHQWQFHVNKIWTGLKTLFLCALFEWTQKGQNTKANTHTMAMVWISTMQPKSNPVLYESPYFFIECFWSQWKFSV